MPYKSPYPEPPPVPDKNIHHLFFNRPEQASWGNHTIHIDSVSGQTRGYQDFLTRLRDASTALGSSTSEGGLGLRGENGDMVGIMSENSMDYITLVHACLKITTPFGLISSYSTQVEFKHALTLIKPTCLFIHSKNLAVVLPVAKATKFPLDKIFLLGGHANGYSTLSNLIENVIRNNLLPLSVRPAKKDTLAYLVFSSGTSGLPKAVMISHGNLFASIMQSVIIQKCAMAVQKPQAPASMPVSIAPLPFYHSAGLHGYCFRSFLVPSTIIILSKWDTDAVLTLIPKYRISNLTLVPSFVHQIVHHPNVHKADLSSVVHALCGAAHLPLELQRKLEVLIPQGINVTIGYGLSEVTMAALAQPAPGVLGGRLKRIRGSLGVLNPGMEARIIREDGSEVDFDEVGELTLTGGNVALGYWNNEKATRETFVNGWVRTGDRFRVDRDGNFYFVDRAKDTLKISGAQVSPVEIEDVLLAHPKKLIFDVVVAGVTGGRTSDEKVPRAWIMLSDEGMKLGDAAVVKELESWHQKNLSKYKWLRGGIEVVTSIPKSPTGKTLRRLLQDDYEQRAVKAKL